MHFDTTIDVNASAADIWSVMRDVERWPEWTESITKVERLDAGEFGVGSRARIKQPGMPSVVWEVTELTAERSFTWVASSPGMKTVATHVLTETGAGTTVALSLDQTGALSGLVGRLMAGKTRRFLAMEAAGLKSRATSF